jgi:hypothetical protein
MRFRGFAPVRTSKQSLKPKAIVTVNVYKPEHQPLRYNGASL